MTTALTDADIDAIADAVPVDQIGVHITTWHRRFARAILAAQPAPVPVGYISKTGHGTYFRETITPELAELEHGGRKMWTPVVPAAPVPVPMTESEIYRAWDEAGSYPELATFTQIVRATESRHGSAASPEVPK